MRQPAVDPQQPWLGLDSFSEGTRKFFHGRDEEVAELARRVLRKPLTVLFGQSGLGKTSILRAGLVPRLRPEGFCPVYLRVDYGTGSPPPAEQLKQAVVRETSAAGRWTQTGVAVPGESLWEFLHHRDDVLRDAEGRVLTPLLIFDQFEEIFTLAQGDDVGRARAAQFIGELADLVENRPPRALEARLDEDDTLAERFDFARCDYRVLIALREDYLAHLEGLKAEMPSITQNRMRLARMTGAQALDAVVKPGGTLVSQEVAEAIVRFVAGGAELRNAEVEPSLLSLICRELNNARIAQGRREISADLLAGSHAGILAEFYQRALADQPAGVRRFIEEELLTEEGFRENIAQVRVARAFAEAGAAPDALAKLVDRRLLRVEERLDIRRVELTHDVLCGVVRASRDNRHEREARDAAEQRLADQQAREVASRRALVRARQIAAVCIVLAGLAVVAAVFGAWGMRRAEATHTMAEAARGESERLIVYLLDDFYRELEPVGRLDVVGDLAKRAIDYHHGLPAALRTRETARNQALAQVRYGAVLRNQDRVAQARQVLDAAVPALADLHAQGDQSEATLIGLSMGLAVQARLDPANASPASLALAERAVAVLDRSARAAGSSLPLRRAHAEALTQLGFLQQRGTRNDAALVTLQAALDTYRGLDALRGDHDAANYTITAAWMMDALDALDRPSDAQRLGAEARLVATQVLARQPTHMLALRGRALLAANAARASENQMQTTHRLQASDEAARDWLTLVRVDPSNAITTANLGVSHTNAAAALWVLGRPRESIAKRLENRELRAALAQRSPRAAGGLSGPLFNSAVHAAELGDLARAAEYERESRRLLGAFRKGFAEGSFEAAFWSRRDAVFQAEYALARGDIARVREAARAAREGLLQLQPGDDPGRKTLIAQQLRQLHYVLSWAELESGDFAAAAQQLGQVAEARREIRTQTLTARRLAAQETALWALALARSGRIDQARPKAAQALAFQREIQARRPDEQLYKLDVTLALLASAYCNPAQAKALVKEAQALFDSMPAEARGLRSSQRVQRLIADARRDAG